MTDDPRSVKPLGTTFSTSLAHQGLTLVGVSFVFFELVFLVLLSEDGWFGCNLSSFGIPCVLLVMALTHLLLLSAESEFACSLLAPVTRGKPPVFYRKFLKIDDPARSPGLTAGVKHVIYPALNEIELSLLGNLVFKTKLLSGGDISQSSPSPNNLFEKLYKRRQTTSDTILKLPFGIISNSDQKKLIEVIRKHEPQVVLNKRLIKRLEQREVKGAALIQQLGAVFLFVVLLDVGYSTFTYLEILKNFYRCQMEAKQPGKEHRHLAQSYFTLADQQLENPLPISWVSRKLLKEGNIAADALETRSEALWALGRKDEAIESVRQATLLKKKNFRLELRMARMLAENGKMNEARLEIEEAIQDHKHAFMPRLYALTLISDPLERKRYYEKCLEILDDETFQEEPVWPPSGRKYIADLYYRDDLHFLFDRIFATPEAH